MLVCPKCGSTYTREQEHCGLDGAKLVQSDADPMLGKTIDKYRIDARLGSGGMATVYRARHQFLEKDYAVKVLHGQIAADHTMSKRFQREAKTLGQIKHPNVVSVDNFDATPAGLLYMVMEFVDGPTLAQVLKAEGALPPARAADIVRQIATGLQAAHRKGFVHRDLKPGNVMLLQDEVEGEMVKLMDFGLVRIVTPDATDTQLTQDGQFFGTPMYMAPEQITGNEVSPATDLYALGVMLYQMLTGRPPFMGDIKKLAFQHVQTAPPKLPSPFGGLSDISRRLMAKNPAERPKEAAHVIAQLDELALTPVSRPPRRVPSPASQSLDLNPTLSGQANNQVLSRPILQEERAFRTTHEADVEGLRSSIDAALGRRGRYGRGLLVLLLLLVGAAGGVYVANGYQLDVDAIRTALPGATEPADDVDDAGTPSERPTEPSDPTSSSANTAERGWIADAPNEDRKTADPRGRQRAKTETRSAPRGQRSSRSTRGRSAAPPHTASADAGVADPPSERAGVPPATAESGPPASGKDAPDAAVFTEPLRRFPDLDQALDEALATRGLSFDDLLDAAPEPAEKWLRLREMDEDDRRPPRERINRLHRRLDGAINTLEIDDAVLERKLERADRDLRVLKIDSSLPAARQAELREQLGAARRATRRRPRTESPVALAQRITAVERAIAAASEYAETGDPGPAEAAPPAPAPPPPPSPADPPSSPDGADPTPATSTTAATSTSSRAAPSR